MKLALLGSGKIVQELLPVLGQVEGVVPLALLSTVRWLPHAQQLAAAHGIGQVTADVQEIWDNPEVDTVYIGTPNPTHYDYAREALVHGKHVVCEKPFTMTAPELEELIALAKRQGLFLFEAITNQHLATFDFSQENLPKVGRVKIVECNYSQYSSRYDAFRAGQMTPTFDGAAGGGALRDLNIYNIHLVVGLLGEPQEVLYLPNMERGVDTSGVLVLDYGDFKAVCIGAKDSTAALRSVIQGEEGTLTVTGATNALPEVEIQTRGGETLTLQETEHRMYAEFRVFRDVLNGIEPERADRWLEHSLTVMRVLDRAQRTMGA